MKLIKQDIGIWVNAGVELPFLEDLNSWKKISFRWADNKVLISYSEFSMIEHSEYYRIEWLKPFKDVYVLTEDDLDKIKNEVWVKAYREGKGMGYIE